MFGNPRRSETTPPGAKAPAALPENQSYSLATDTLFSEPTKARDRWHLSGQACVRALLNPQRSITTPAVSTHKEDMMRWEVPRSGKNHCGLGLNQNLPFLDRHLFVYSKASLAPGRRSRCLAILDVAQATPPGAKAPAALPEIQSYPLATNTLFSEPTKTRDRCYLSTQAWVRALRRHDRASQTR